MSDADDRPPEERVLPAGEAWDVFKESAIAYIVGGRRRDVEEAMFTLEERLRAGQRPTAEEIRDARRAIDHLRELVEDEFAALASGTEPWGDGAGQTTPYSVMEQTLEDRTGGFTCGGEDVATDGGESELGALAAADMRLSELIEVMETIDWAAVPEMSVTEAATWTARLIEARDAVRAQAPGTTDNGGARQS